MLLTILDGQAVQQQVLTKGQEAVVDQSGIIAGTALSQIMLNANPVRSGWVMQNRGTNVMYVNEIGSPASASAGSFMVLPGVMFPPEGFPVSSSEVTILGTGGDAFTAREW